MLVGGGAPHALLATLGRHRAGSDLPGHTHKMTLKRLIQYLPLITVKYI